MNISGVMKTKMNQTVILVAITSAACLLVAFSHAGDANTGSEATAAFWPPVHIKPTGKYSRIEGRIEKAVGKHDLLFFIGLRDEKILSQAWAMVEGKLLEPHDVNVSKLELKDSRITGDFVSFDPPYSIIFDVAVTGDKIEGTCTISSMTQGIKRASVLDGINTGRLNVTGAVISGELLSKNNALAPEHDWPCLRGPYANGSARDCGMPMVENHEEARLLWVAEDDIPNGYGRPGGGYNGPTVKDGLVYVSYWCPDGKEVHPKVWEEMSSIGLNKLISGGNEQRARRWLSIDADDVIACFDATTGALVWKTMFPGRAINSTVRTRGTPFNKMPHQATQCLWKDKVFAIGQLGMIYCLDAASGTVIWIHEPLNAHGRWKQLRQQIINNRLYGITEHHAWVSPNVIGGVLLAAGSGFDAESGRQLWTNGPKLFKGGVPLRWVNDGKEYAIFENTCIDPATGKTLWKASGSGYPLLQGNVLILVNGDRKLNRIAQRFRISITGAEKIWETDGTTLELKEKADTDLVSEMEETPQNAKTNKNVTDRTFDPTAWFCQDHKQPAIQNGHVFVWLQNGAGEGTARYGMCSIDVETGKIVKSVFGEPFRTGACCAHVASDGLMIFEGLTLDRVRPTEVSRLGANGNKGISRNGNLWGWSITPALSDGRLFVRLRWSLAAYDLRKP